MSNKRIRTKFVIARLSPHEHAAIMALAGKRGMSPGALIRQTLLNVPPGPNTRRPTVDEKLLSQLIAELGKVGSNLNQIAKHLSAGRPGDRVQGALGDALRDVSEWRTMLMQAIGEERYRKIKH
jgi:hypothetical protein